MILRNIFKAVTGKNTAPPIPDIGPQFLEAIGFLTASERDQLRLIGAESPSSLYSAIVASPEPFTHILSSTRIDQLLDELYCLIPANERAVLEHFSFSPPPVGLMDESAPSIAAPDFDVEERDRLFDELQSLKSSGSSDARRRAKLVEAKLNALLDGRFAKQRASH